MPNLTLKGIPADLYDRLKESASAHRRSINAEAIERLDRSLRSRRVDPDEFLARADALRKRLDLPRMSDEAVGRAKRSGRP